jgi:hypothetical protein
LRFCNSSLTVTSSSLADLQLLLCRLQLLVAALQLLVARLRLLVDGAQLLHRALLLLDHRLQLRARRRQQRVRPRQLAALAPPRRLGRPRARRRLRNGGAFEQHQVAGRAVFGRGHADHHQGDDAGAAIAPGPVRLALHRPRRRARRADRRADVQRHRRRQHSRELQVGLPRRWLQVGADIADERTDLQVLVDIDARRCVAVEQHALEAGIRVAGGRAGLPLVLQQRRMGGACRWPQRRRRTGRLARVDTVVLVDHRKQAGIAGQRFGAAEEQHAARLQGVVEDPQHAVLQRPRKVDQQVAAADQVEVRERRVAADLLAGEDAQVPQLAAHLVAARRLVEIALQVRSREMRGGLRRKPAGARRVDVGRAEVAAEQLDLAAAGAGAQTVEQQHADGVDLLAARAAGHPHADRPGRVRPPQQRRNDLAVERAKRLRIAEEAADVDQQIAEQAMNLVGVEAQMSEIGRGAGEALERHPPCDAPPQRALLVLAEVHPGGMRQHAQDRRDRVSLVGRGAAAWGCAGLGEVRRKADFEQPLRDPGRRQHEVDAAGADGAGRHAVELGAAGLLGKSDPAFGADALQAGAAVAAGTGKDDAARAGLTVGGQAGKETVDDRRFRAGGEARPGAQDAAAHGQLPAGRTDVDVVCFDDVAVAGLAYRHAGFLAQQRIEDALAVRIHMRDDHERHARLFRQRCEQLRNGRQPPGRSADADDREHGFAGGFAGGLAGGLARRPARPGFGHGRLALAHRRRRAGGSLEFAWHGSFSMCCRASILRAGGTAASEA